MENNLLSNYLLKRGLLDPKEISKIVINGEEVKVGKGILDNDEILERVAGIYKDDIKVIEAVIESRITPLIMDLILSAVPEEVMVIRQSILELVAILDDFKKYADEHTRRLELKDK